MSALTDSRQIVPSVLYRVQVFESRSVMVRKDGGHVAIVPLSTQTLEEQIDGWVERTKNAIVGLGPVNLVKYVEPVEPGMLPDDEAGQAALISEVRLLAVTYIPPVETGDAICGAETAGARPDMGPAERQRGALGQGDVRAASDGPAESGFGIPVMDGGLGSAGPQGT